MAILARQDAKNFVVANCYYNLLQLTTATTKKNAGKTTDVKKMAI